MSSGAGFLYVLAFIFEPVAIYMVFEAYKEFKGAKMDYMTGAGGGGMMGMGGGGLGGGMLG